MSLERIDNRYGHTVENCVLIANEFNTADHSTRAVTEVYGTAQWSRTKVADVFLLRSSDLNKDALVAMAGCARKSSTKCMANGPSRRLAHDPEVRGKRNCVNCGELRATADFCVSSYRTCKYCRRQAVLDYSRTLRGGITRMLLNAKRNSKLRGHVCDLSLDETLDKLLLQEGRCFYSGVPMECMLPHSHWRMSPERLDNRKGYTNENVVLIANEFNSTDHSSRAKYEVHGSAQWSRAKVESVWGAPVTC
jgi:hypothetical protein